MTTPLFEHDPHPWCEMREKLGPPRVADVKDVGSAITRFNTRLALLVTKIVGSMWCAYAFGLFDLISLPSAIHSGKAAVVSWIAQTFLQLVLLSVIMVGQNIQAAAADKRSESTYLDAEAILHEVLQVHAHLEALDAAVKALSDRPSSPAPEASA